MHELALIGSRGLFGGEILKFYTPSHLYNSDNIQELGTQEFDTVICAAPSGNRRAAQADPAADTASVDKIITALSPQRVKKVILIGSIDAVTYPDSVYGSNRLRLEKYIKQQFQQHYVLRFGNIIDDKIKKNILYDLKHDQFLEYINLDSNTQWYPLGRLQKDIQHALTFDCYEQTLVSEPIQVREIVERFFPEKINRVGTNPAPRTAYNQPWVFSKQLVFDYMSKYCQ